MIRRFRSAPAVWLGVAGLLSAPAAPAQTLPVATTPPTAAGRQIERERAPEQPNPNTVPSTASVALPAVHREPASAKRPAVPSSTLESIQAVPRDPLSRRDARPPLHERARAWLS